MAIDIETTLNYEVDIKTKPYLFAYPRTDEEKAAMPEHGPDYGGKTVPLKVTVKDGRQQGLKFDVNSFELFEQETKLSTDDFYNNQDKIVTEYYPEMVELIKEKIGAEHVIVFHHQVRNAKLNTGSVEPGKQNLATPVQGYAGGIHTDSHVEGADTLFQQLTSVDDLKKYRTGRYLYLNIWRNISDTPIHNNHLAVLDQTSVISPDDYLTTDLFFMRGSHNQQYRLSNRNAGRHKWYYFSRMKKNEVLFFKQFDSDPTLSGRMCFHTAFEDPKAAADAPVRESIEIRAYAFFPDHEPNTCPEPIQEETEEDEANQDPEVTAKIIEDGAKAIHNMCHTLHLWPESALSWLKGQLVTGKPGVHTVANTLAQDFQGHLGLKQLSASKKKRIAELLLADDKFENDLISAVEKIKSKTSKAKGSDEENAIANGVSKVMGSMNYLEHWPKTSLQWLKEKFEAGNTGVVEIATTLVADEYGHLKLLDHLNESQKKAVVTSLTSDADFMAAIKAGLEKLNV